MIGSFITATCQLMGYVSCRVFLAKCQVIQMTQPCNSPDLAPCDFWLFPKLKSPLKGKRFQITDEIKENMMGQLMAIPTEDFAECFEEWKRCWENCVRSQGVPTLKGAEVSLSYVQCFLYLLSSSINISIFHSTWLDTFWIDLCIYIITFSFFKNSF